MRVMSALRIGVVELPETLNDLLADPVRRPGVGLGIAIQVDVLLQQLGGETPVERSRDDVHGKLGHGGVVASRRGVENVDHALEVEPNGLPEGDGLARRDHRSRRQEIVEDLHGLALARFGTHQERLADAL